MFSSNWARSKPDPFEKVGEHLCTYLMQQTDSKTRFQGSQLAGRLPLSEWRLASSLRYTVKSRGSHFHDEARQGGDFRFASGLPPLRALMTQVATLEGPTWQELSGCPLANSQTEAEVLSPTALEEVNPVNNHVSFKGDASPLRSSDQTPSC